jgi:nifR3 family TIM-barrel protein
MIKIGNQSFENCIFLAPLAGTADLSFRLIARECGASFCFFEMIDANSLLHQNTETLNILKIHPNDQPIGGQLLGSDPAMMVDAAHKLLHHAPIRILDINSACPVKKIIKKGCGAHLLTKPDRLIAVIKALTNALPIPITVKLRVGFDSIDTHKILHIAKQCEDAGAQALFVHGRTREQAYRGAVSYETIKAIKDTVTIPVFGSGNILSVHLAQAMFDQTGCDGILVARGAFGNPWILNDIAQYRNKRTIPEERSILEKILLLKRHLAYMEELCDLGETGKIGFMRKVAQWYLHGFPKARQVRNEITHIPDYHSLRTLIDTIDLNEGTIPQIS